MGIGLHTELDGVRRLVRGGTFALDLPPTPRAIWGSGNKVLWSSGESLFIVGLPGVGKSTLALRLVLSRLAIDDTAVLGYPVAPSNNRILYLAADRPLGIRRSLHRMVTEEERETLNEGLVVHEGPLDFDIGTKPRQLLHLVEELGARTVVLDSLKDLAFDLAKEEAGSRVNFLIASLIAEGIEVLVIHHQRKPSADNRRPKTLADVYGSTWLTAGAGSVLLLWGKAGDSVLQLRHLKAPMGEVGPLNVQFISEEGRLLREDHPPDLLELLRRSPNGLTAREGAQQLLGKSSPSRADTERIRKRLEKLAGSVARKVDGKRGGRDGGLPSRYYSDERY